jgi:hypothetical protein
MDSNSKGAHQLTESEEAALAPVVKKEIKMPFAFVEKYKQLYLKAYQNGKEARIGIGDYFRFYNTVRPHQAFGYRPPRDIFTFIPFEEPENGVIESLTTRTVGAAGHYLNLATLLS